MLCFQSGLMFWAVNFNGFRFLSGVRLTAPCLRNLVRSHWWDDQEHHGVLKCCWCAATCRLLCYFEYWNQIATISFAPDMYCFIPNTCFTGTFFFSVVLLLRPWWYWFYIYIHIYTYIYIICNRFTVALNQEALEARIEVSWHSGLKVWWWSFLAIVASNRSREAKVILGSFATRIFSSLQRLQCFCVFFCIWRETSLYTQRFRPHLIPSFALTAGQIYHVGPSSPEAEVHPVTVSVALCKRD
jgi:hypothetical protein